MSETTHILNEKNFVHGCFNKKEILFLKKQFKFFQERSKHSSLNQQYHQNSPYLTINELMNFVYIDGLFKMHQEHVDNIFYFKKQRTHNNIVAVDDIDTKCKNIIDGGFHIIFDIAHGINYGHFLHDHCTTIYHLLSQSVKYKIWFYRGRGNLPTDEFIETMKYIIPDQWHDRVSFFTDNEEFYFKNPRSLMFLNPSGSKGFNYPYICKQMLDDVHKNIISDVNQTHLIFCERTSSNERRQDSYPQNEEIKSILKQYCEEHSLEFYVHSGVHTIQSQIELFSKAKVVVGFHGAAMANIAWCRRNENVHVLEFLDFQKKADEPVYNLRAKDRLSIPPSVNINDIPVKTNSKHIGLRGSHNYFWGGLLCKYMKSWNIFPCLPVKEKDNESLCINLDHFKNVINNLS